jgi:asparagine synthase (glutamine-hydrolysing)
VPLGAFLSGGVDSSSVVAMMALESGQPVKTFTIGFEEQVYDERPFARAVAERYATDHHEFILRPDALSILDELVYHYNEPFADSSAIPTYYVSKIAREHVTVALNGDGADESFVGYTRYLNCRRLDRIDVLPPWLVAPLARTMRALPSTVDAIPLVRRARRALTLLQDSPSRRYEPFIAYFTEEGKEALYGAGMAPYKNRPALARLDGYFAESTSMAMGAAWADIHTYLPDDLLVKVDIASMANSLEARSPFLDHELMSWAATIPENQRFAGSEPKALLKKAMEPFLPRDLLYRPKMGFGVPVELWLRGELKEIVRETLLGRTAIERGLFRREAIEDMLTRHWSGENFAPQLWALLMLELWFQMWIDPAEPFAGSVPERLGGHTAAVAA